MTRTAGFYALCSIAAILLSVPAATAQTPGIIGFHGYLTDLSGNAVDAPEGKDFGVRIYHEAEGGDAFWEDTFTDRPVVGGVFRILLGSSNNAIPAQHFDGGIKYIGIVVDGGQELSPRLQLVTVPYALRADTADTALVADSADALGGVAAANFATTSQLTKYDAYQSQIAALEAKIDVLEAAFANPNCTNECPSEGATGCSEDFGSSWVCVKPAGEACLKQETTACTGQNLCEAGVCTCKPNVEAECGGDGNAYAIDSCGQPGQVLDICDPGQCSYGKCIGWLRETPLALNGMQDVFVVGGDLYAVGNAGKALHYDGQHWREMATGTTKNLHGIWGYQEGGLHKLYAVGDTGKVLHYDGAKWSTVVTGNYQTLREVFGLSPSNVLAVGDNGTVLRFNGTSWSAVPWDDTNHPWSDTAFHAVWAHSSSQIWVAGAGGTIIHNDGTTWSAQDTPDGTGTIRSLWGISADSVWGAAGNTIVSLNSGEWNAAFSAPAEDNANFNAIWVQLSGNLSFYAVSTNGLVYTFDGAQWTKQDIVKDKLGTVNLQGVMGGPGAPFSGVWLIANGGEVAYRDPSEKWIFPTVTKSVRALYGVAGQPNNTFALGSDCLSLRYDNGEWLTAGVDEPCATFNAIWGDGTASTIIAVGDEGTFKMFNGETWENGTAPPGTADNHDVWGLSATELFVVRSAATMVYDGVSWQNTGGGGGVAGFGTSMTDFHVVTGNSGVVQSFDGSEWSSQTVTSKSLVDIYGSGSEMWVVGTGGAVYQNDGSGWVDRSIDAETLGGDFDLRSVWTTNLAPVYVAGQGGNTWIFNGFSWSAERTTPAADHNVVYGSSTSDVLLGGDGTIFRRQ